jgi:hypothetical protein
VEDRDHTTPGSAGDAEPGNGRVAEPGRAPAPRPANEWPRSGLAGAPEPPPTLPSRTAFLLAFGSVVLAGLLGGIIGFGLADLSCTGSCGLERLLGTIAGAAIAAVGVGIVAVLVLRAMAEWHRREAGPRRSVLD